ncbi:hypothetical protein Ais01nite_73830 [Asanoa ishikariensis]|uniref:DNA processing protein n=1 Tax=Asanoa ishikariensis TaxID=137265 RepID=A0A1H3URB1_9ACTN|nr:DNA-processing protein DprA [Asanoa ishikariensis]GIF69348.1 hypothetical protein Ais01nite_73830 [Asanoa ishikariensis]SDZ65020.1 DNA processing protein [Asanoa ishikariensis]
MTDPHDARIARAVLGFLLEPGDQQLAQLLAAHGPVDGCRLLASGEVSFTPRRELSGWTADQMWDAAEASAETAAGTSGSGRVVIPDDEHWPVGLDDARDWAPVCLWVSGPGWIPQPQQSVTVVGARACTAYGEHVASDLASGLADQGRTLVTSNGFGVDRAVLRAGMVAEGHPVAVLPCGLDELRSDDQAVLAGQLGDAGLLMTAFAPGAQPTRARAELSRLYLAVLTAGTVVVEASLRGLALGVASEALRRGRVVMAVPGPITSAASTGCHRLLRDHPQVRPVTSVPEILTDLRGAFTPVWPRPEVTDAGPA